MASTRMLNRPSPCCAVTDDDIGPANLPAVALNDHQFTGLQHPIEDPVDVS
jgi:hypothetical protein